MNTLAQAPVTEPLVEFSSEDPVIAVRLLIPTSSLGRFWYPENNRIATDLLCRLLVARIAATQCGVRSALPSLQLNRACFLFALNSRPIGLALEAIREELSSLQILIFSQIAWHDPDEGIWRMFYPIAGIFPMPSKEEFAAESWLQTVLAEVCRLEAGPE